MQRLAVFTDYSGALLMQKNVEHGDSPPVEVVIHDDDVFVLRGFVHGTDKLHYEKATVYRLIES